MKFDSKKDYLDFVENRFNKCFCEHGYIQEKPVKITSQIDKSVDFIGSKISPLKHYLIDNNIPKTGVSLIQNCMKLRTLKSIKNNVPSTFGSCYRGMGTITQYDLDKVVNDTFDYFLNEKYLNIDPEDIHIRINSKDLDLIEAISQVDNRIIREYDTEPEEAYKHVYGLQNEQITGRNLNIALRKTNTNEFFDCSAIIVMENPSEKLAIDMGIGNSSLGMCYFNTDNTVASSRVGDIITIDGVEKMKFADCIVTVSTLSHENILEHPSKHFRKKFRQYVNALIFWQNQLGITNDEVVTYINKYIELEYREEVVDYDICKKILIRK